MENIRKCNIVRRLNAAGLKKGRAQVRNFFADGLSVPYDICPKNVIAWISSDHSDFSRENVHHRFVLKTITKGRIRTILDGVPMILQAGDAMLFSPYQVHISSLYEEGDDYEMVAVTFILAEGNSSRVLEPLRNRVFPIDSDDAAGLVRILQAYQGNSHVTASHAIAELTGILQRKLARISESISLDRIDLSERMAEICNYIRTHLCERISVKTIASEFGVSRETIRRDFRKYFGTVLPAEMMRILRMQYAAERLCRTDDTIAKIADECGYGNPFIFSAAFHKYSGVSPSQYRKRFS